jgi:hypothetical protein
LLGECFQVRFGVRRFLAIVATLTPSCYGSVSLTAPWTLTSSASDCHPHRKQLWSLPNSRYVPICGRSVELISGLAIRRSKRWMQYVSFTYSLRPILMNVIGALCPRAQQTYRGVQGRH